MLRPHSVCLPHLGCGAVRGCVHPAHEHVHGKWSQKIEAEDDAVDTKANERHARLNATDILNLTQIGIILFSH